MPKFDTIQRVPYSAQQMFALVADVEKYPLFLPMCESLAIRQRREHEARQLLIAEMGVGYKAIRQHFTTQVLLDRAALRIDVQYIDGPFRRLDNCWRFEPDGENACKVHFSIDYEFANRTLGLLMGSMFDIAFRRFTQAFEDRARVVYGEPRAKESPAGGPGFSL